MGKETIAVDAQGPSVAPGAVEFDLTLDEFCRRLSADKVTPELIGGFHHTQVAVAHVKASSAAFAAAFDRFAKQPA